MARKGRFCVQVSVSLTLSVTFTALAVIQQNRIASPGGGRHLRARVVQRCEDRVGDRRSPFPGCLCQPIRLGAPTTAPRGKSNDRHKSEKPRSLTVNGVKVEVYMSVRFVFDSSALHSTNRAYGTLAWRQPEAPACLSRTMSR